MGIVALSCPPNYNSTGLNSTLRKRDGLRSSQRSDWGGLGNLDLYGDSFAFPAARVIRMVISHVTLRGRRLLRGGGSPVWSQDPGEPVGGASDAPAASVKNMSVDHCRAEVLMAQQLLDRADIVSVFQQVSRKRMS